MLSPKSGIMNTEGQGAMEYLMTYGWTILVVMLVGVVLWNLGVFGWGSGTVNTAGGFRKIKPMEQSIKYTEAGSFSFSLMNGVGQDIRNVNIVSATDDCSGQTATIERMGPGEVRPVSLSCRTKATDQSFSTSLTFEYESTVADVKIVRRETGTIRGIAEP